MRRLIALVARLYPRNWRAEFGDEFDALLDDVEPGGRVLANVLGGAIRMQMTEGRNWKLVAATTLAGALAAGGFSFAVAPRYVSTAEIGVTTPADPLRPLSFEASRERGAGLIVQIVPELLSRQTLSAMISDPSLNLYLQERRRMPMEDVVDEMRRNIHIESLSADVFRISFSYPDRSKAQATVRELARKLSYEAMRRNQRRADAYRSFWRDMSAHSHLPPAPPPPIGQVVSVLKTASLPAEASESRRAEFLAWGLGAGLALGLIAAVAMRWSGQWGRLGRYALAGGMLACALSFLISNRFTSTATMEIGPATLNEDPMASLPEVTSAAEFLRRFEPDFLSVKNLSKLIADPRLNLYPKERSEKSMDEVVRNMLAHDLRIAPVNSLSGTKAAANTFSISFSYSDRKKASDTVNALITLFIDNYSEKQQLRARRMSYALQTIADHRGGELLKLMDAPITPMRPESPNRLAITLAGLVVGSMAGFRRS